VTLDGTWTLYTDLEALSDTEGWSSDTPDVLFAFTDGFRITVSQTIYAAPASEEGNNGMCFGRYISGEDVNEGLTVGDDTYDAAAAPFIPKHGVFCVAYYSGDGDTGKAAISSRKVSWQSPTSWDGSYDNGDDSGTELTGELYGRVDTPNVDSTADADGYDAGATITASWYQPWEENDDIGYSDFHRLSDG
jgi:hypothetical protein